MDPFADFYNQTPTDSTETAPITHDASQTENDYMSPMTSVASPSGYMERPPAHFISLFVSKMGIPLDNNNITYPFQSMLKDLGIKGDDFVIVLHSQFFEDKRLERFNYNGGQRMIKIQDLLQMAGYNVIISNDKYNFTNDDNGKIKAACIWNGTDDEIPTIVDNYRFSKVASSMKLVDPKKASMWSHLKEVDAICVTTNGCFKLGKSAAYAVAGRGSALHAKVIMPSFKEALGNKLKSFSDNKFGNACFLIGDIEGTDIVAFPTKPRNVIVAPDKSNVLEYVRNKCTVGETLPGYQAKADKELIDLGLTQLAHLFETHHWKSLNMPMLGCGNGELDWKTDLVPLIKANAAINPHLGKLYIAHKGVGRQPLLELLS